MNSMKRDKQIGQSLLELVIVIAVSLLVVGAITFATISSLRNAQQAQNQNQATKLAQEGIEKVRSSRDRNGNILELVSSGSSMPWSDDQLWDDRYITNSCSPQPCYFNLESSGNSNNLRKIANGDNLPNNAEGIGKFKRVVILEDGATNEKQLTVIVAWNDFAGDHESKLSTYLRRLQ